MIIPDLPYVPIDMNDETIGFLGSLEDRLTEINVVRLDGNILYVLGTENLLNDPENQIETYHKIERNESRDVTETTFKDNNNFFGIFPTFFTFGLYQLAPHNVLRRMRKKEYQSQVERFKQLNLEDIEEKISGIRVYQGTIGELQSELGKPLRRVETDKPETFIEAHDPFWLRVKAYQLGADAVVHYQPGSSIGTPVRYSK